MEPIRSSVSVAVVEETHVAAARRAAAEISRRLNLSEAAVARAELIAVELAGNILHHAECGQLYFGPTASAPGTTASAQGLQMIACDRGPGLGDIERAMADGYSTRSTPGLGLGAIRRKASVLDVYSRAGEGAVLAAVVCEEADVQTQPVAVLSTPLEGESLNGDSWAIYPLPGRTVYLMVDGLGHGYEASVASSTAIDVANRGFESDPGTKLSTVLQRMHQPMHATRGAAVMLISVAGSKVLCCGAGNISATITAPEGTMRTLVSHNGTVGHRMTRVQEFEYTASPGSVMVMHSDGISARWKLTQYPGVMARSAAVIAGMLYRDFSRMRDDATVLVAQLAASGSRPAEGVPLG